MLLEELCREAERQFAPVHQIRRHLALRPPFIPLGLESQDDVIDRDAQVELTLYVEAQHLVCRIRRLGFLHVRERAAVAHDRQRLELGIWDAEELWSTNTQQPMTLSQGIAAGRFAEAVDDALRYENAIIRTRGEHLVRVDIVALAHASPRSQLSVELEARIDQILAVGKEVLHPWAFRVPR